MKKLLVIVLITAMFVSCTKTTEKIEKPEAKRIVRNKVLIILGKDYCERPDILQYFRKDYAYGKENSKIELFTYREMLNASGNIIFRALTEKIDESNCDIVIALGAPEGSGRYLQQAKTAHPEKVYIALLPMEDTLQLEATCDIVIDLQLPDTLMNEEASFTISDKKLELLLVASVFAAEDMCAKQKNRALSPYDEFNRAFFTAYSVLFSRCENAPSFRLSPYVDPTTSIPSRKYFIVYENDDTTLPEKSDQNKSQ